MNPSLRSHVALLAPVLVVAAFVCATVAFTWAAEPRPLSQKVFMRVKLASSQKLLEGLVTRDFDLMHDAALEMKDMSEASEWPRADDSTYTHYNLDFQRHCRTLARLADEENLAGAAFTYQQITSACINCHDYVRTSLRPAEDPASPFQLIPNWDKDQKLSRPETE